MLSLCVIAVLSVCVVGVYMDGCCLCFAWLLNLRLLDVWLQTYRLSACWARLPSVCRLYAWCRTAAAAAADDDDADVAHKRNGKYLVWVEGLEEPADCF